MNRLPPTGIPLDPNDIDRHMSNENRMVRASRNEDGTRRMTFNPVVTSSTRNPRSNETELTETDEQASDSLSRQIGVIQNVLMNLRAQDNAAQQEEDEWEDCDDASEIESPVPSPVNPTNPVNRVSLSGLSRYDNLNSVDGSFEESSIQPFSIRVRPTAEASHYIRSSHHNTSDNPTSSHTDTERLSTQFRSLHVGRSTYHSTAAENSASDSINSRLRSTWSTSTSEPDLPNPPPRTQRTILARESHQAITTQRPHTSSRYQHDASPATPETPEHHARRPHGSRLTRVPAPVFGPLRPTPPPPPPVPAPLPSNPSFSSVPRDITEQFSLSNFPTGHQRSEPRRRPLAQEVGLHPLYNTVPDRRFFAALDGRQVADRDAEMAHIPWFRESRGLPPLPRTDHTSSLESVTPSSRVNGFRMPDTSTTGGSDFPGSVRQSTLNNHPTPAPTASSSTLPHSTITTAARIVSPIPRSIGRYNLLAARQPAIPIYNDNLPAEAQQYVPVDRPRYGGSFNNQPVTWTVPTLRSGTGPTPEPATPTPTRPTSRRERPNTPLVLLDRPEFDQENSTEVADEVRRRRARLQRLREFDAGPVLSRTPPRAEESD